MMLVAVIADAIFHYLILQPKTLILGDGFRRDVGEIEDFFGNVIIIYCRLVRERWVGPVVVYIEFSDAVVVVVMVDEFTELNGNFFHEETCAYKSAGAPANVRMWTNLTYILRDTPLHQPGVEVDLSPVHPACNAMSNDVMAVTPQQPFQTGPQSQDPNMENVDEVLA